jgi:hypothetical protein
LGIPVLNTLGRDDICRSWVMAQNLGEIPSQALLVAFDLPGNRSGGGPLKVECSGLIRPGAGWSFLGAQIPSGSAGAMLFSVNALRLSELGVDLGFDDVVGEYLCQTLFYTTVGQPDSYARFRAAYESGAVYAGLPMAVAAGSPMAATVLRHCPGSAQPGVEVSSTYPAIEAEALDAQGHRYMAGPVRARDETRVGDVDYVYAQNLASQPATVELRFRALEDCGAGLSCGSIRIDPGFTALIQALDCAPEGSEGSMILQSDQPLAVSIDSQGIDMLSSVEVPEVGTAAAELLAPLVPEASRGWDATVLVHNPDLSRSARVTVQQLGPDGEDLASQTAVICAGGSHAFLRPMTADEPGFDAGSLRVISLDAVPLLASLQVTKFSDTGRTESSESALYRLEAPDRAGGLVMAIPVVVESLDDTGSTSEIALANYGAAPGAIEAAIYTFDHNGLLSTRCRRIEAGQTHYIDLQWLGSWQNGGWGSVIVSAVWWSHAQVGAGAAARPSLGLAQVLRTGTRQGEDVPGDELAISQGFVLNGLPESMDGGTATRCLPQPGMPPPTALPPVGAGPNDAALAAMTWLPTLRFQGQDNVCAVELSLRNTGDKPARALLVGWGEPGFVSPQSAGPTALACSDPIAAGETWIFDNESLDIKLLGAVAYSLSTATMAELGLDPGSSEPVADVLCDRLANRLPGDPDADRRFRLAFLRGQVWDGIPLNRVLGSPLEIDVRRDCPGDQTPGREVTSRYRGLAAQDLRDPAAANTQHVVNLQPVVAERAGYNTYLYIQNVGLESASVSLKFASIGDCLYHRACRLFYLAAGETYQWGASDCVGPDWLGNVVIEADQPIAVLGEYFGRDEIVPRAAFAGGLAYDINADGRSDAADVAYVEGLVGSVPGDAGWDPRADLAVDDLIDENDLRRLRIGLCRWTPPDLATDPPEGPAPRAQTLLPVLSANGAGRSDCDATLNIQNLGQAPAKAILILWNAATADTPEACEGPSKVECTGLISPGGTWTFSGGLFGAYASGLAFGVDATVTTDGLGLGLGFDDSVADLLCETLFFTIVGDCDDYRQFKRAWDGGELFAQIPLDRVPAVPLAIDVQRDCASQGRFAPVGRRETVAYAGIGSHQLGAWDAATRAYGYFAPVVLVEKAAFNGVLWLQNAGLEPASVELWYRGQNDCGGTKLCGPVTVQPGETARYDSAASQCAGPDWQGTVWARSSQPLGVVTEISGRGVRFAYPGRPGMQPETDLAGDPLPPGSGTTLYGPVTYANERGWDVAVNVQNTDLERDAWVDLAFLDSAGRATYSFDAVICAGNTETFFVPVMNDRPLPYEGVGSVRVRSRPPEGRPWEPAAQISGVAWMIRYTDVVRSVSLEALAYDLLPDAQVGAWPLGQGEDADSDGSTIVAVSGLHFDPDAGFDGQLVISNQVGLPGHTEVSVLVHQGAKLISRTEHRIAAGGTQAIDLVDLGLKAPFMGSALVSASYWDHAMPGPMAAGRPRVGLSAALIGHRGGGSDSSGQGGQRSSLSLGQPLRQLPAVDLTPPEPSGEGGLIYLPFLVMRY